MHFSHFSKQNIHNGKIATEEHRTGNVLYCCCEFNAPMLLVLSVDYVESSLSDVKRMKCLRLSKVVKCFVFLFHTMFVQLN